jgi:hypothetical protein
VSVLLGVVAPLLLWVLDGWVFQLPIGPGPLHFGGPLTPPSLEQITWALLITLECVLGYLFVLGLGVFTSSLCANSAKAIIMNIGLMIASGSLAAGLISRIWTRAYFEGPADYDPRAQLPGQLALALLFVVLFGFVQYLAYSNYRNGEPSPRRTWMQLGMVVGSIAAGVVVFATLPDWCPAWAYL